MKMFRVHVNVSGLRYTTFVRARSHKAAAAMVSNPMGGKVKTVLLKVPAKV